MDDNNDFRIQFQRNGIDKTSNYRTDPFYDPFYNRPFKQWASIFNNDNTLASAVLDRLLHHAQTVVIEGQSYRMKDQANP